MVMNIKTRWAQVWKRKLTALEMDSWEKIPLPLDLHLRQLDRTGNAWGKLVLGKEMKAYVSFPY